MGREIKFRIWDKQSKKSVPTAEGIMFNGGGLHWYLYGDKDNYIIQQFTGLLDANSKEIYEGDICNIRRYKHLDNSRKWIVAEVIWGCEHGWGFRSYYNGKGNGDFYGTRFVEAEEIEIIGNIFENPELLK